LTSILGKEPHGLVAELFVDPSGDAPVLRNGTALACFSQAESFLERERERSGAPFGKDVCLIPRRLARGLAEREGCCRSCVIHGGPPFVRDEPGVEVYADRAVRSSA
jgi:hypothetical protein